MTVEISSSQVENKVEQSKPNDKEYNFRALEAKYQRQLEQERTEREKIVRELEETKKLIQNKQSEEDDEDSEPYIDKKRLAKTLNHFEKKFEEKIDQKAEEKARRLFDEEKKNSWLETNRDFYDVMQHAEKLAQKNPDLAEMILRMPEGFERQKLVYANIKALGLDKSEAKQTPIQEKIDANKRTPYYQPTGIAAAPYAAASDFSEAGQKAAYLKMQETKKRLGLR